MNHQWKADTTGRPDDFAYEVDTEWTGHNGPRCTRCGFFFCEHCWPDGWQQPCPGTPPAGMEYYWFGDGTTREPETVPDLTPTFETGGGEKP